MWKAKYQSALAPMPTQVKSRAQPRRRALDALSDDVFIMLPRNLQRVEAQGCLDQKAFLRSKTSSVFCALGFAL